MTHRIGVGMIALILVALAEVVLSALAHQDPCDRLYSRPSDHTTLWPR